MSEQKLVPKLRFKEFSDEWTSSKLKEICIVQDGTHSTPNYTDSGIPFFSVDTIINNVPPKYISEKDHKKLIKRCEPKKGDILLSRITGGILGFPKLVDWDYEFSIYVSLALLSSITINSNYLNYYIQSPVYRADFLSKSLLIASPPKINLSDLEITLIKYPSAIEQEKISNFISLVDKKIGLLEQKYQHYQEFKKYLMQQIFAQKLRFDFDDEWKEYSLKDLGTTYGGLSGMSKEDFNKGNSTFIPYKSVFDNNIIDTNLLEPVELNNKKQNKVQKGDLFFTGSSETPEEVGMAAVLTQELSNCYLNSFCFGYRLNETSNIDSIFLSYYLRSPLLRNKIKILAQGSTRFNISKKELMKLKMDIPNLTEQKQIVNLFTGLDLKLSNLENQHSEMTEFKKGLLQQMLI